MSNKFVILVLLLLCFHFSLAQEKKYQLTIIGGVGASVFFEHVKQPAISARLFIEKLYDEDAHKYLGVAIEYSSLPGANPETKLLNDSRTTTVTYTYGSAFLLTITGAGKKILDNNFFYGVGIGFAVYGQSVPSKTYSDFLLGSTNIKLNNEGFGLGSTAQFGYLFNSFQFSINYHGGYIPFRTIDLSNKDGIDFSSFVAVVGISVGYTF
jgi:hypothetical protein